MLHTQNGLYTTTNLKPGDKEESKSEKFKENNNFM